MKRAIIISGFWGIRLFYRKIEKLFRDFDYDVKFKFVWKPYIDRVDFVVEFGTDYDWCVSHSLGTLYAPYIRANNYVLWCPFFIPRLYLFPTYYWLYDHIRKLEKFTEENRKKIAIFEAVLDPFFQSNKGDYLIWTHWSSKQVYNYIEVRLKKERLLECWQ